MATTYVQLPDGKVVAVDVPEGGEGGFEQKIKDSLSLSAASAFGKDSSASRAWEAGKVADKTFRGGLLTLPGLAADALSWASEKAPAGLSPISDLLKVAQKSPNYKKPSVRLAQLTGGAISEPETEAGKSLGNVGEATVSALMTGGALPASRRALIGAASGVGGEVGKKLSGGGVTGTLAGSLLGGGLAALGSSFRPNMEGLLKPSMKAMTEGDWAKSRVLKDSLDEAGVPNLASQFLGPNSSVDDIVAQASANPEARPIILSAMRGVVPRATEMMQTWTRRNLPPNVEERRGLFADIQSLAKKKIDKADAGANEGYAELLPEGGEYAGGYLQSLRDGIVELANSDRYGASSEAGKMLLRFAKEKLPEPATAAGPVTRTQVRPGMYKLQPGSPARDAEPMRMAHVNNLLKDLNAMGPENGWGGLPKEDLKGLLRSYTPEFADARAAKTLAKEEVVNPLKQSLVGQIANMGGGVKQDKYTATGNMLNLVFPKDKAQPQAIQRLGNDLGADPVGWLLSDNIEAALNQAGNLTKTNPSAPADIVTLLAGNAAQRANINAALRVVAESSGRSPIGLQKGFFRYMKALNTYRDVKVAPGISGSNVQFEAGKSAAGTIAAPQSALRRFFWERASSKTYKQIAELVTNPRGLELLEEIAKAPDQRSIDSLIASSLAETLSEPETK